MNSLGDNNVSEYAHIAGGISGGVFGFIGQKVKDKE
jgi:hypothetical protein